MPNLLMIKIAQFNSKRFWYQGRIVGVAPLEASPMSNRASASKLQDGPWQRLNPSAIVAVPLPLRNLRKAIPQK